MAEKRRGWGGGAGGSIGGNDLSLVVQFQNLALFVFSALSLLSTLKSHLQPFLLVESMFPPNESIDVLV